jgi:hypothetical protein
VSPALRPHWQAGDEFMKLPFSNFQGELRMGDFRSIWGWALFLAVIDTSLLIATGVDEAAEEFRSLTVPESVGLVYGLFVLPWYLAVTGVVGELFWKKKSDRILLPGDCAVFHFLNGMFLFPALVVPLLALPLLLNWAFEGHSGKLIISSGSMALSWSLN